MKTILIKTREVKIDDEDYEYTTSLRWRISPDGYVHAQDENRKDVRLHRIVMKAPKGLEVDHINHDTLDNRKENLRLCNRWQNKANTRPIRTNTSGFKGVSKHKGKWQASIRVMGKLLYLGRYDTKELAAASYNEAAQEHFGDFAWLNPLEG